jgi:hypothetical protein
MNRNLITIDLDAYISKQNVVLAGRENGQAVRTKSKIEQLVKESSADTKFLIIVPDYIASITPSFLEGFLRKEMIDLGKERFQSKFVFKDEGDSDVNEYVEETVDRVSKFIRA